MKPRNRNEAIQQQKKDMGLPNTIDSKNKDIILDELQLSFREKRDPNFIELALKTNLAVDEVIMQCTKFLRQIREKVNKNKG